MAGMRNSFVRVLFALLAVATIAVVTSCGGDDGSIEVEDARYRLGRPDLGAAYLAVTNTTGEDITIESASADGVGRIELHETLQGDDGAMTMQEATEGFTVADGETLVLEPGGKHLMLFDPEGTDDLEILLDFGDEEIEFIATFDEDASAAMSTDEGSMGDMDDMDMDDADHSMDDMDDDGMDESMDDDG